MEILNSLHGEGVGILGQFDYSPAPWNSSLAIRTGGRNERDSSESNMLEFESITIQSCFNFQAILNRFFKMPEKGEIEGMAGECKQLEYQGELHHFSVQTGACRCP